MRIDDFQVTAEFSDHSFPLLLAQRVPNRIQVAAFDLVTDVVIVVDERLGVVEMNDLRDGKLFGKQPIEKCLLFERSFVFGFRAEFYDILLIYGVDLVGEAYFYFPDGTH